MININWNTFKKKFEGKETSAFEDLAYILFCSENNIEIGIFGFFNQTGIEREPVQIDKNVVGFQAKYYETELSKNKADMIDSIEKAKRENKELSKILFYLNQRFGESPKKGQKDPKYKIDIEDYAKERGIEIEWRCPDQIEFQLIKPENNYYKDMFFSEKSILDFIHNILENTERIFNSIDDNIKFKGRVIKITRTNEIKNIKNSLEDLNYLIISGQSGCGKTAIIKNFYEELNSEESNFPFYLFKADQFNNSDISCFFKRYGDYSIHDFQEIHKNHENKIIVIDSAEKLIDMDNSDTFNQFIVSMTENSWKIIFTTRNDYLMETLDNLPLQSDYNELKIQNLSFSKLYDISNSHKFNLPSDNELKTFLTNLFYLKQYLKILNEKNELIYNFQVFKEKIWELRVLGLENSSVDKRKREKCFIRFIEKKANENLFSLNLNEKHYDSLFKLINDEIITYDDIQGTFFVNHDLYEELALKKIIDIRFNENNLNDFLKSIDNSIKFIRAFKKWVFDKLSENNNIYSLIDYVIFDLDESSHWKKDSIIPILLSNHSSKFFKRYEKELFNNDKQLLKIIINLLELSCKEEDKDNILNKLTKYELNTEFFTKPVGSGWKCVIDLIYNNLNEFNIEDIKIIIPLLKDWNDKNSKGNTTKLSSLIALHFYQKIQKENFYIENEIEEKIIKIILTGAFEIKSKIRELFNDVLRYKWKSYKNPHNELCKIILTEQVSSIVWKLFPNDVFKISNLFWYENSTVVNLIHSKDRKPFFLVGGHDIGVEKEYSLNRFTDLWYFPPSAFQTPIFSLLNFFPNKTIDFIIDFVNKTVKSYVKFEKFRKEEIKNTDFSKFSAELDVEVIEIQGDDFKQKQFIDASLFSIYRGTSQRTTPYLLQSIHMALEKFLLELSKSDVDKTKNILLNLLKKSESASLTAVVISIVLSEPNKYFEIVKILFRTIDLFIYDNVRSKIRENSAETLYNMYGFNNNNIFSHERKETLKEPHRKLSLEDLAIQYQFFQFNLDQKEFNNRKKEIESIIDSQYKLLDKKELDKEKKDNFQMILARIDRRKMNPVFHKIDDTQGYIELNPEISEDLQKSNELALENINNSFKYLELELWAYKKIKKERITDNLVKYDKDIEMTMNKIKDILNLLKNNPSRDFLLSLHSIPVVVSCVLIREYETELSYEDKKLCKELIVDRSKWIFKQSYHYQISHGIDTAIETLPFLFKLFPRESDEFYKILLLASFHIEYFNFALIAIRNYFSNDFTDFNQFLHEYVKDYIALQPIFEEIEKEVIKENSIHNKNMNIFPESTNRFFAKHNENLKNINEQNLKLPNLSLTSSLKQFLLMNIFPKCVKKLFLKDEIISENVDKQDSKFSDLSLISLLKLFLVISENTSNKNYFNIIKEITSIISERIFSHDFDSLGEYRLKDEFMRKLALFILSLNKNDIKEFLQPFVDNFRCSREMNDLLGDFISLEANIETYYQFWEVWNIFYENIEECSKVNSHYSYEIVKTYLLDWSFWNPNTLDWNSLKEKESTFFYKVCVDMGFNPSVLEAIAKLLNGIGHEKYFNEGIIWINIILKNNNLNSKKIEKRTISNIEKYIGNYITKNIDFVNQNIDTKEKIINILDFLIKHGSNIGYSLKERL